MRNSVLRKLREDRKMTQKQLGDAIGVKPSCISRYENGSLSPSRKKASAIASALDVDIAVIMDAIDDKPIIIEAKGTLHPATKRMLHHSLLLNLSDGSECEQVVRLVVASAQGTCELCHKPAPFIDKNGRPYLDVRVIDEFLPDEFNVKNLIALCPDCSRRIEILQDPKDLETIKEIASKHNY